MTNKTFRGLVAFWAILATAACAFGGEVKLDNVHWNQDFPYNSYMLQSTAEPNGYTGGSGNFGRHPTGCVQTAYAQLVAFHEWPAIIDDEYHSYGAFDANSLTYTYQPHFFVTGHEPIDWEIIKNGNKSNEAYNFQMGRLHTLVASFAFPLYSSVGTASTVSCPHYNPWYESEVQHYSNPETGGEERDKVFQAIKESIDAGLPVAAGFQSSQGPHAVVLQGYRTDSSGKVSDIWVNLGWGGSGDTWSNYSLSPAAGKNSSITGVFPMHAPRKMVQIAPISAVSAPKPTIEWFAPKYWKDKIERFDVSIAKASSAITDWTDPFTAIVSKWPTVMTCGGADKDDHTQPQRIFKVENNELHCYMPFDPRYYEWPNTFVATHDSVLRFESNVCYTDLTRAEIQIKVANQPWRTLYDLNEGGLYNKNGGAGWMARSAAITDIAGQPFKLRISIARYQRGTSNEYLWKLRNFRLEKIRQFETIKTLSAEKTARALTLADIQSEGEYEISVAPVIEGQARDCFRTVSTRVSATVKGAPELSVTHWGKAPKDGVFFQCGYTDKTELEVKSTQRLESLKALCGNLACYTPEDVSAERVDDLTWKVTLTPNANFLAQPARANGQRMMLTLVGIDANGTASYKDLSLEFCSKKDGYEPPSEGGGSFVEGDFYLPAVGADEWVFTLARETEDCAWDEMTFTRADGATCLGSQLPTDAKVRIVITDPVVPSSYWDYKSIRFPSSRTVSIGTLTFEKISTAAPIRLKGAVKKVSCKRLNVGSAVVYHEGIVLADTLWVGYQCKFVTAGGYLDCFKNLAGTGTVEFQQNAPSNGLDSVNHSRFYGYITGQMVEAPAVTPDPELIGTGGGSTEGGESGGGSTGEVINTNAQDPVKSITRDYGYDMTEMYWDARKQAIQTGKLLFVLSGSDSCNWCHETMVYLQRQAAKIDARFVVYYARRQNGDVPMRGGLPQYGSYDPRTIDAFTGCYDENGKFDPTAAWYSGHDNAFASERSYSVPQIDRVISAPGNKTVGKFLRFELDAPKAVVAKTPTKLRLYAIFDDEVKMEVDYGVEWLVVDGDATITSDGVITAKTNGKVTVSARNAFYNFNAEENKLEATMNVVPLSDVQNLRITSESFNLEDNPDVRLKAVAVLSDGTETDAAPVWTARIKSYLPLPSGAPLYQRQYGAVVLNDKVNGQVFYRKDDVLDGINLQDHILEVSATLGETMVTKEITVYGPTRIWVTDWELITPATVAPGSVVRAKVKEMKYIYRGEIHTTKDTNFATFTTGYVKDMLNYSIANSTSIEFSPSYDSRYKDGEQLKIRLEAKKKGGKYSGTDYDTWNESVSTRTVTFRQSSSYYTSKNDIRVNEAWLRIYYPNRTDFAKLVDEDTDEDGFTTAEEFLLGTDPTKTEDRWAFTSSHFDWPNEVYYRVMFMGHTFSGRIYTIEGAANLNSTWYSLGTLNTRRDTWMADENIARADQCRVFRVKVKFDDANDPTREFTIPGYGVWNGVTLNPQSEEKYSAFVVDANNLNYPLTVNFLTTQDLKKPIFSVPTEQVMPGTLDRFEPTAALKTAGWRFVRKTDGIWTAFYAVKGLQAWSEVEETTEYALIPGITAAEVTRLTEARQKPTALAQWAMGKGDAKIGDKINLDCFVLNAANGEKAPELTIDAEDLEKILAAKGDLEAAAEAIKPKYPNAKVVVRDVTDEICGKASGVRLFTLSLSL